MNNVYCDLTQFSYLNIPWTLYNQKTPWPSMVFNILPWFSLLSQCLYIQSSKVFHRKTLKSYIEKHPSGTAYRRELLRVLGCMRTVGCRSKWNVYRKVFGQNSKTLASLSDIAISGVGHSLPRLFDGIQF